VKKEKSFSTPFPLGDRGEKEIKKVIVLEKKRKIDKVKKFVRLRNEECSKNQKYLFFFFF